MSSGEFLDFAKKNRAEWENHGEEVVAEMYEQCKKKYGIKGVEQAIHATDVEDIVWKLSMGSVITWAIHA